LAANIGTPKRLRKGGKRDKLRNFKTIANYITDQQTGQMCSIFMAKSQTGSMN
jgi:hypothetical protein